MLSGGLNDGHFDAALEHISAALEELNVPADLLSEVMAAAEGLRADVLSK